MTVAIHQGDCLEVLASLPADSVDAGVTDPPYHLASIVKRFGKPGSAPARPGTEGLYERASRGFMGKQWDGGSVAFEPATWAAVLRVLKPGGHMVAFGAPKNAHRLTCAIEDAGFEIRDALMWVFGSGFPKSHNLAGEWEGWGTALKPAYEPIILARKPVSEKTVAANVLLHGTGAIHIDPCRVDGVRGQPREGEPSQARRYTDSGATNFAATPGPRGGSPDGRWPANLIHDGSDEVLAAFPDAPGQQGALTGREPSPTFSGQVYGKMARTMASTPRNDSGSAARFFYAAKANAKDRAGSKHPTVKPVSLMRYLCRLITPPGGVIIDPFAGSGTTGQAATEEGFDSILIEREAEYVADIRRRLGAYDMEAMFA